MMFLMCKISQDDVSCHWCRFSQEISLLCLYILQQCGEATHGTFEQPQDLEAEKSSLHYPRLVCNSLGTLGGVFHLQDIASILDPPRNNPREALNQTPIPNFRASIPYNGCTKLTHRWIAYCMHVYTSLRISRGQYCRVSLWCRYVA